jgi:RimJ/RimL family protein N-acetyltransferase
LGSGNGCDRRNYLDRDRLTHFIGSQEKSVTKQAQNNSLNDNVLLRDVIDSDLPIFFKHQLDPAANYMAAFTAEDPADRDAFNAHWTKILGNDTVIVKTILFDGQVAGHIASFERFGEPEVTYWIGKEYWSQGLATRALSAFLNDQVRLEAAPPTSPLYARAAKDNIASIRVLEKCGFTISGYDKGFANARGQEIEEVILIRRFEKEV